ncbi:MAG: response regulator [Proteobacteria bacterium]|nr:response regulator [Pseudomonadota bacterium]
MISQTRFRIFLIIVLFIILLPAGNSAAGERPYSREGFIDLTSWDFDQDGIAELSGDWEFYWQQLLSPEDFKAPDPPQKTGNINLHSLWTSHEIDGRKFDPYGYATYRLLVKIKPSRDSMTLMLSDLMIAHRLWVNGQLLSEDGVVGVDGEKEIRGSQRISFIPLSLSPTEDTIEIVLQISNHEHWGGGAHSSIRLGPENAIKAYWVGQGFLLIATISILLIIGLYHLVLYGFRRKDPSALLFSFYCFLWLMCTLSQQTNFWLVHYLLEFVPPGSIWRFELFGYFIGIPVLILFYHAFYPKEMPKFLGRVYLVLSFFFCLLTLFFQESAKRAIEDWFNWFSMFSLAWGLVALIRAMRNKRQGSVIHFSGLMILAPFGVNDVLHDMRIIDTGYYMPLGLIIFIFVQAISIALRFSKAFTTSEQLAVELRDKNIALSKLDTMKDEFLANTSHELRTPLSGIIGIAESMLAGAAGKLHPSVRKNLDMVAASGRRLASLVNDILDFSRLKNKDLNLHLKSIDLRTLVDTVLMVMTPLANSKGLILINDISDNTPPVQGDEDRLQQIFYNLIGNSIKFTEQGTVTVSATPGNPQVEVAITDTGIGIPEDKLDDIFKSFEQVDAGAARKFGGTGLGLPITKHLVELHQGAMRVESEVGSGTAFFFTLPVSEAKAEPAPQLLLKIIDDPLVPADPESPLTFAQAEPDPAKKQSGYLVLVVDDDPVNLQVAINHLMMEGHDVRTATGGAEALEIIDSNEKPDLVLLDIMMPGMTGYEVCRKLRGHNSASELPVIMLTARNRVSDLVEGFESGANDYLTKPFSREELLSRVNAQLQLKEAFQTLAENVRLKKELARRRETQQDLLLMQRRLAELLDTVDDAVFAVNESEEITFSNRTCLDFLGYDVESLLGRSVWSVFSDGAADVLRPMMSTRKPGGGDTTVRDVLFQGIDDTTVSANLLITTLELEDELLNVFLLRKSTLEHSDYSKASVTMPVLTLISELNRNQERLRSLEETLNGLLPGIIEKAPAFQKEIKAIDSALEEVGRSLLSPEKQEGRNQLAVAVMHLCIDYWVETTGTEKFDLARQSGLWKVYTNQDGWERTQTLDKYLEISTLPQKPRWKLVMATADFVLTFCNKPSSRRDHLETTLTKLRLACH